MDDGLYVDSVWYSCKINKMKTNLPEIANEISKLSAEELDKLSSILTQEYNMSATLYHFPLAIVTSVREYTTYKESSLYLTKCGDRKLQMIKTCKEIFGWGLKEAKTIIDSAPCYLKEFMPTEEAEDIKVTLESIGATIEIKYHEN